MALDSYFTFLCTISRNCFFSLAHFFSSFFQEAYWLEQYSWALFKAMSHMLCIGYGRCGLNKLYALNTQSSFTQTYILFFFFLSFRIPLSLLTTTQVSSTIPDRHVANNAVYDIWSNMLCPIFGTCDQSNTEFRLQSSTISRAGMYDDTGSL